MKYSKVTRVLHFARLPLTPLRELTHCGTTHMGLLPVTRGDIPAFSPPRLVLDLATQEGCKAELTECANTWNWSCSEARLVRRRRTR